jgi:hypothetical protein
MRNDVTETADQPSAATAPLPSPPLLVLAADDDAVCTDELCLPAEALVANEAPA